MAMVGIGEVTDRLKRVYGRRLGGWVAGVLAEALPERTEFEAPSTVCEISLRPPTEREVLEDTHHAAAWVSAWRTWQGSGEVLFETRRWSGAGEQSVPSRVVFSGVAAIAREAGRLAEWERLGSRARDVAELVWRVGVRGPDGAEGLLSAVSRLTGTIASMSDVDWERTIDVLAWLGFHPGFSCYARELPVRGIDTKWVERHRKVVTGLAGAILGLDELPFRRPDTLIRVRDLGGDVLPGGFKDAALSAQELAALSRWPSRVIVCENLVNVLTLPELPATLAVFGKGKGAGARLDVPWLDDVDLVYWGDLDTHGFHILDDFRAHHPNVRSVLMDRATLMDHRDLWAVEESQFTGELTHLTEGEAEVYEFLLASSERPRLEQERIPYSEVVSAFEAVADVQPLRFVSNSAV